jgi:hypothetical protein
MDSGRIPLGELKYIFNEDHCYGRGYSIEEEETKQSLQGQIYDNHHLVEELSDLREDMASLATTEFEQREIAATLASFMGWNPGASERLWRNVGWRIIVIVFSPGVRRRTLDHLRLVCPVLTW